MKKLYLIFITLIAIISCSSEVKNDSKVAFEKTNEKQKKISDDFDKKPNKSEMILQLNKIVDYLEAKNHKDAMKYFVVPKGLSNEKIIKYLSKLIPKKEISKEGINILKNEKFLFGSLTNMYGQDGVKIAKKFNVDIDKCYGISTKDHSFSLEIMAIWNDSVFNFLRIDNIGKVPSRW